MDDVSPATVATFGAMADDVLDLYVRTQVARPNNFKDLVDVLMLNRAGGEGEFHAFFLATLAATAVIRLAASQMTERSPS